MQANKSQRSLIERLIAENIVSSYLEIRLYFRASQVPSFISSLENTGAHLLRGTA